MHVQRADARQPEPRCIGRTDREFIEAIAVDVAESRDRRPELISVLLAVEADDLAPGSTTEHVDDAYQRRARFLNRRRADGHVVDSVAIDVAQACDAVTEAS